MTLPTVTAAAPKQEATAAAQQDQLPSTPCKAGGAVFGILGARSRRPLCNPPFSSPDVSGTLTSPLPRQRRQQIRPEEVSCRRSRSAVSRGSSQTRRHTRAAPSPAPAQPRGLALTLAGLKLTFLALPCSSPETAGWLLKPCFTFRAVSSSCGGRDEGRSALTRPGPDPRPGPEGLPRPAASPPPHLLLLGVLRVHVGRAEARAFERTVLVAEDAEGRHTGRAGPAGPRQGTPGRPTMRLRRPTEGGKKRAPPESPEAVPRKGEECRKEEREPAPNGGRKGPKMAEMPPAPPGGNAGTT